MEDSGIQDAAGMLGWAHVIGRNLPHQQQLLMMAEEQEARKQQVAKERAKAGFDAVQWIGDLEQTDWSELRQMGQLHLQSLREAANQRWLGVIQGNIQQSKHGGGLSAQERLTIQQENDALTHRQQLIGSLERKFEEVGTLLKKNDGGVYNNQVALQDLHAMYNSMYDWQDPSAFHMVREDDIMNLLRDPKYLNAEHVVEGFVKGVEDEVSQTAEVRGSTLQELKATTRFLSFDEASGDIERNANGDPVVTVTPQLVGLAKKNEHMRTIMEDMVATGEAGTLMEALEKLVAPYAKVDIQESLKNRPVVYPGRDPGVAAANAASTILRQLDKVLLQTNDVLERAIPGDRFGPEGQEYLRITDWDDLNLVNDNVRGKQSANVYIDPLEPGKILVEERPGELKSYDASNALQWATNIPSNNSRINLTNMEKAITELGLRGANNIWNVGALSSVDEEWAKERRATSSGIASQNLRANEETAGWMGKLKDPSWYQNMDTESFNRFAEDMNRLGKSGALWLKGGESEALRQGMRFEAPKFEIKRSRGGTPRVVITDEDTGDKVEVTLEELRKLELHWSGHGREASGTGTETEDLTETFSG